MTRKIAILTSFSHASGAPMAALRLARGLRERGHQTHVAAMYRLEDIPNPDHPYDVFWPDASHGPAAKIRMASRTLSFLKKHRPEVVVSFLPLATVISLPVARLLGIRGRIVSHRVPVNTYTPAMQRADHWLARTGSYSQVVAVSGSVADSCAHYPESIKSKISVVHNGLSGFIPSSLSNEQARTRLGIGAGMQVLLAVGRLMEQKNFGFLLPILQQTPQSILLIAGEGELRSALEAQIRELGLESRVCLLGAVQRREVPDLLAACDLFVQPSLFEGQSNALLEALYAGVPALVSNVPEQVETVQDEQGWCAGAFLPLDDIQLWVTTIEKFRTDPACMAEAKIIAAQRAEAFSYPRMIEGFEKAIENSLI